MGPRTLRTDESYCTIRCHPAEAKRRLFGPGRGRGVQCGAVHRRDYSQLCVGLQHGGVQCSRRLDAAKAGVMLGYVRDLNMNVGIRSDSTGAFVRASEVGVGEIWGGCIRETRGAYGGARAPAGGAGKREEWELGIGHGDSSPPGERDYKAYEDNELSLGWSLDGRCSTDGEVAASALKGRRPGLLHKPRPASHSICETSIHPRPGPRNKADTVLPPSLATLLTPATPCSLARAQLGSQNKTRPSMRRWAWTAARADLLHSLSSSSHLLDSQRRSNLWGCELARPS